MNEESDLVQIIRNSQKLFFLGAILLFIFLLTGCGNGQMRGILDELEKNAEKEK